MVVGVNRWQGLWSIISHWVADEIHQINLEIGKLVKEHLRADERLHDITKLRHLVGEGDPFIVVPLSWTSSLPDNMKNTFSLSVGDFAVVLYDRKVYPAIVGDEGPHAKCGEASLFLAKQLHLDSKRINGRKIDASTTPFWDLEVSYLVFPGTAAPREDWGVLDLKELNEKCRKLVEGTSPLGDGVTMHQWPVK